MIGKIASKNILETLTGKLNYRNRTKELREMNLKPYRQNIEEKL